MKNLLKFLSVFCLMPLSAQAATGIPFTINMSEAVTVSGCPANCPRIAVDVGGVTRYAEYSAGSGTNTLTFTYQMVSGDVDLDGVSLSSPIDLNGGSITDLNGNNATLTFVPPNTSGILVNAAVPSGYTATFIDRTVTNANKTAMGFTLTHGKAGHTYNYTISSSGGGTPLTGTGTTTGAAQAINGINLTSLQDGKLTLSVTVTDSLGGTGVAATDTVPMAVLDASLVGHWTFDANDISGVTAYDRSGQGNSGTLTNGPTQVVGQVGGALNFDGVNDFVAAGDVLDMGLNDWSVVAWVKTNGNGSIMSVVSKAAAHVQNYRYATFVSGAGRGYPFMQGNGGADVEPVGWADVANGAWHLLSIVFDRDGNVDQYVDGAFDIGQSIAHWQAANMQSANPFRIGSYTAADNISTYAIFNGFIDDVRIYNRALSAGEIATLYSSMQ